LVASSASTSTIVRPPAHQTGASRTRSAGSASRQRWIRRQISAPSTTAASTLVIALPMLKAVSSSHTSSGLSGQRGQSSISTGSRKKIPIAGPSVVTA
jgi:hypothetical protein